MSPLVLILILILLFGGGGFYAHSNWGGPGLGGALGLALVILLIFWLIGGVGPIARY